MKSNSSRRTGFPVRRTVMVMASLVCTANLAAQSSGSTPPTGSTNSRMMSKPLGDSAQSVVGLLAIASRDEIEGGRLALTKAKRADVKSYAQRMIDDHTKALRQLDSAHAGGWKMSDTTMPPTGGRTGSDSTMRMQLGPDAMKIHDANVAAMQKLSSATAEAFDTMYIATQIEGHDALLKAIDKQPAGNAQVSGMVASMKATVQQHLEAARKLQSSTSSVARP